MIRNVYTRLIIILAILGLALWIDLNDNLTIYNPINDARILNYDVSTRLGLDLRGGLQVLLEADLADMPDQVPTLAVVAAFSQGTTVIRNVAHLKSKESDRLSSTVTELKKMGIEAACTADTLVVRGGKPKGAVINTYNDHRIAMSFAIAGLRVPGVCIRNESCVEKSFPAFWQVLEELYQA